MIHPSQLTKEAGFEEGVVVEIVFREYGGQSRKDAGYLHIESETELWLKQWDEESIEFDDVTSIRPLTGPMAIWNHCPEWAESVSYGERTIEWFACVVAGPTMLYRPFWAIKSEVNHVHPQ